MRKRVIFSAMLGNAIEWYDFAVFAQLSIILTKIFFPNNSELVGLINTFAVFALGFVVRPLGGIVIGKIGDQLGRRNALYLSIIMISIATFAIGLLPSYGSIGIAATIGLIVLRMIQGLSIGGENGGSFVFASEYANKRELGFYNGCIQSSFFIGILAGSLVSFLVTKTLSQDNLMSWGWRLPFFFGGLLGVIGFVIRYYLKETSQFLEVKQHNDLVISPIKTIFKSHYKQLLLAIILLINMVIPAFTLTIFLQNFLTEVKNIPFELGLEINCYSLVIAAIVSIFAGLLSDKLNKAKLLMFICAIMIFYPYLLTYYINKDALVIQIAVMLVFTILVAFYNGIIFALLFELFPTNIKYSGISLSINTASALFGGTTSMFSFWLINNFGTELGLKFIAYYLSIAALLGLAGLLYFSQRSKYATSNIS